MSEESVAAAAPLKLPPLVHLAEGFLAFNKPSGLLTIPGRDATAASLWRLAEAARGERLWAVHRLDRDTSGLVLFARNAAAHRTLNAAFAAREVEKHYLAWVTPPPDAWRGSLRQALVPARRGFMRLARLGETGQLAETDYAVLQVCGERALLDLRPRTGRTHQLRLQLAALGSPIVGDAHYRTLGPPTGRSEQAAPTGRSEQAPPTGRSEQAPPIESAARRLWLHAWKLRFRWPEAEGWLDLEAPPPPEMAPPPPERVRGSPDNDDGPLPRT